MPAIEQNFVFPTDLDPDVFGEKTKGGKKYITIAIGGDGNDADNNEMQFGTETKIIEGVHVNYDEGQLVFTEVLNHNQQGKRMFVCTDVIQYGSSLIHPAPPVELTRSEIYRKTQITVYSNGEPESYSNAYPKKFFIFFEDALVGQSFNFDIKFTSGYNVKLAEPLIGATLQNKGNNTYSVGINNLQQNQYLTLTLDAYDGRVSGSLVFDDSTQVDFYHS